jgi:hypothetical protein
MTDKDVEDVIDTTISILDENRLAKSLRLADVVSA